jgi:hypothetical protein
MPDPPPGLSLAAMTAAAALGPQPLARRCTVYRWTGSIRDDGLRVFRAEWHG